MSMKVKRDALVSRRIVGVLHEKIVEISQPAGADVPDDLQSPESASCGIEIPQSGCRRGQPDRASRNRPGPIRPAIKPEPQPWPAPFSETAK